MDYGRRITEVLLILAILLAVFLFGPDFFPAYNRLISESFFNPCKNPIQYSIGQIDPKFGLSEDYFIGAVKDAENMWETASGENLFEYKPGAGLKINFIYDYRQSSTSELNNLNSAIEKDNADYSKLKADYDNYVSQYDSNKSKLDSLVSSYQKKPSDNIYSEIISLEQENSLLVSKINALAQQLNNLAGTVNLNVKNYNDIGQSVQTEFEQGNYVSDLKTKEINIYQFDDRDKLVKVLAHEMGHALDIGHMANPNDLMYALNVGENQEITPEDLSALKDVCSRNGWVEMEKLLFH